MSHVLMCRGSSYSKASSSRMRCSSIAVYVPCCDTFGMSCLRHIACSFLRTHFLHILRSVSICIFAQRSITELISAVLFLASAISHRHFFGRYCFLSQHTTSLSYVLFRRSDGQCFSWFYTNSVLPAEELLLEFRITAQNSSYVGAVLMVAQISRFTCRRLGTLGIASYSRRRTSTGTLEYSTFIIRNYSSLCSASGRFSVC